VAKQQGGQSMKTSVLMYGEPADVANELCSCNEPEDVLHVDLIAALGNALNRIAKLEAALSCHKTGKLHKGKESSE
jgi:hypothetical protein